MGILDDDDNEEPTKESGFSGKVPDFVRKALMTGIGAVFMTEEGVRSALGDIKLPKDAMGYLIGQADRTKREVIHTIARELRTFLDGLELEDMLQKSLSGATFEINTTIRVIPKDDGGLGLEVKDKKLRRVKDEDDDDEPVEKPPRKKRATKSSSTKKKRSPKEKPAS